MEQIPEAVAFSRNFFRSYGQNFETPIEPYRTLDDVKVQLLDFGVTTKSLEAVSLFADSFSVAEVDSVVAYMESKLDVCRSYIKLKTGVDPSPRSGETRAVEETHLLALRGSRDHGPHGSGFHAAIDHMRAPGPYLHGRLA